MSTNDTAPWPPVGYRLPTAERPVVCTPAAPPAPPSTRPDVVGNLIRTMRGRKAAKAPAPRPRRLPDALVARLVAAAEEGGAGE